MSDDIRTYAELQRKMADALRAQNPEWIEADGDCPTCDSYEGRLAELLSLFSNNQIETKKSYQII